MVLFWAVSWYAGATSVPVAALPDRRVLYLGLFLVSATLFGGAVYTVTRFTPPGTSQDEWWRANLPRAVLVWAMVEGPAIIGTVAYLFTHDFRTLLAPFTGLLLFVHYRPSRLAEG
jgi:hypothetical protein